MGNDRLFVVYKEVEEGQFEEYHFTEQEFYRHRARGNWAHWRLILPYGISYDSMRNMSYDELMEANAAMDLYNEAQQRAMESAKTQK